MQGGGRDDTGGGTEVLSHRKLTSMGWDVRDTGVKDVKDTGVKVKT